MKSKEKRERKETKGKRDGGGWLGVLARAMLELARGYQVREHGIDNWAIWTLQNSKLNLAT
jgi:hypothetical protein